MKLDVTNLDALKFDIPLEEIMPEAIDNVMPHLVSATHNAVKASIRHEDTSTGELLASIGANDAKQNRAGGYYAGIKFPGTGSNGTRNALKAAELEYGNSYQAAAPFADSAVNESEGKILKTVEAFVKKAVE